MVLFECCLSMVYGYGLETHRIDLIYDLVFKYDLHVVNLCNV